MGLTPEARGGSTVIGRRSEQEVWGPLRRAGWFIRRWAIAEEVGGRG